MKHQTKPRKAPDGRYGRVMHAQDVLDEMIDGIRDGEDIVSLFQRARDQENKNKQPS